MDGSDPPTGRPSGGTGEALPPDDEPADETRSGDDRPSLEPGAELLAEGRRRYEAGDVADAEPLARRVVELRPAGGPAGPRAEALQLLAETQYSGGRYVEAAATAGEARALRDDGPPEAIAETDNLLGIIALARGDVAGGLPLIRGAFEAREAILGPDASDTIESLNNLAAATARDGRVEEALALNREALVRGERGFDGPHRGLAVTLNGLAVKLDRVAETRAEAGRLYARALDVAEAALGPEHPLVATLLANIATQRMNAGDVDAARAFVTRSIDLHERRYGHDHPNTATAILNAAELARHDGDLVTARAILERALSIRLAAFGPTDVRTRQVLVRLLTVLGGLKDLDPTVVGDGIFILAVHRAVAPGEGGAATPDPALIERLAGYLARRLADQVSLADDATRAALERARLAAVAADAAFMAGDRDAARVALDGAIAAIEAVRGPADLGLVEPLRRRAAVARADDRRDDGIADDERALAIVAAAYGGAHPYVLRARVALAHDLQLEYGPAAARGVLAAVRAQLDAEVRARSGEPDPSHVQLLALLDRHLARIPADAVAEPVGRSARRRAALVDVAGLAGAVLPGLDRIGWAGLASAHGPARDVPANIRLLLADDRAVVVEAGDRLADSLLHQGSLYPATVAAIEPLSAVAGAARARHRGPAIELLSAIVAGAAIRTLRAGAAASLPAVDAEVVRAITRQAPAVQALLERLSRDPDGETRAAALAGRALLARAAVAPDRSGRAN